MWNNSLRELWNIAPSSQCEMKFAHIREANISHLRSKYFTAKLFHLPEGQISLKKARLRVLFSVICVRFRCKAVCGWFRCTLILQRVQLPLGDDGSCTWPLSSGAQRHACNESYVIIQNASSSPIKPIATCSLSISRRYFLSLVLYSQTFWLHT